MLHWKYFSGAPQSPLIMRFYLSICLYALCCNLTAQEICSLPPLTPFSSVIPGIPEMNGGPIADNVNIYAFDMEEQCVGNANIVMSDGITYFSLNARGDDAATPEDEGLTGEEEFEIRLYDEENNEYTLDGLSFIFTNTNGAPDDNYPFTTVYDFRSAILPVDILALEIYCAEQNTLEWASGEEEGFAGFAIQHSSNGELFQEIAWQDAKGSYSNYSYSDRIYREGYYRLKMMDLDSSYQISEILACQSSDKQPRIEAYPNPTADHLRISITNVESPLQYGIFNAHGQLVKRGDVDPMSPVNLSLAPLPSGMYSLQLVSGSKIWTRRIVKK